MRWVIVLVAIAGALFVLDAAFLAMERRGWIYWRRRTASTSTASRAMLSVQSLLEPSNEEVVEERRREDVAADTAESGDPPRR